MLDRDRDRRVEHVQDYDDQARVSMLDRDRSRDRDRDRRVEHVQDYDDQAR
ncbi:RNA recognition motif, partial [Trifolium medium]|nr:RNA recognition motif [Trifolium medium]